MRFASLPLRNLWRRPLRTALTILGVAAALAGFSILTGLGRGMEEAWNQSLVGQGTQLLAYRRGVLDLLTGTLDVELAARMRAEPGVESVAAELVDVIALDSGATILLRGWEPGGPLWDALTVVEGRLPEAGGRADGGDSSPLEVVVGEGLAEALGLRPGGELALFGAVSRVAGVVRLGGVFGRNSAIFALHDAQRLLDREGKVTVLNLRIVQGHEAAELEAACVRLAERFPQLVFTPAHEAAQHNELFSLWRNSAWATSLVGLALGLVIVVNTLLVAVLERTREIGLLVAVGWSRGRIFTLVLLESLLLSAVGGVLGMVVGQVGLELFVDHPKLRGFVAVAPSVAAFAQRFAVTILLGIAAGLYPAWRAVRLNPVDALRDQ